MWKKTSKCNWILEMPLIAQIVISLTCSNFSNYFEKLWCIISSSFAFPSHFSFHFLLVDAECDLPLPQEDLPDTKPNTTQLFPRFVRLRTTVSNKTRVMCKALSLCPNSLFTFHTISQLGRHKRESHTE